MPVRARCGSDTPARREGMRFLCTQREFPSCFLSWGFTRGVRSCQVLRSLLELPGGSNPVPAVRSPGGFRSPPQHLQ